jgi:predicted dehydrogenase
MEFNCKAYSCIDALLSGDQHDIIICSVINKYSKYITENALLAGCHVLIEKPLGLNPIQSQLLINTSFKSKKLLMVGFNHRHHPAISRAHKMLEDGTIGSLMYIRGIYGHGGRRGMENEWRSSRDLCGGGELIDQGSHLIDLSRWFAGEIKSVFGRVKTKSWDIDVEDNVFVLMESHSGVDIQLHASWTEWKNNFSFSLFGTKGYLKITGLGGSYGDEILEIGIRREEGGVPYIEFYLAPEKDISWESEWYIFKNKIRTNSIDNSHDGLKANKIIEAIYHSSRTNKIVKLSKKFFPV